MRLSKIAFTLAALVASSAAWSHGYITQPESRVYKCKVGSNTCGDYPMYNAQSIEQLSGFPGGAMPRDGELASGSLGSFKTLDRQAPNIWALNTMKSGVQSFSWHHTAPHNTRNWRYYITKQNWDVNKPLTREAFEVEPFCVIDGHGEMPPTDVTHQCNVPDRTGYQVIYGVWEISNTANSFYQIIDVNFEDDGVISEWSKQLQGHINGQDLQVGDKVTARFFGEGGEVAEMQTELEISGEAMTDKNLWSRALAEKINSTQKDVRAGTKDKDGNVNPIAGNNYVFARKDSTLKSVELSYQTETPEISEEIHLNGLDSTKIQDGNAKLSFNAEVKGKLSVEARVFDHHQIEKGYLKTMIEDASQPLNMELHDVSAGHHMLKVIATNDNGQIIQPEIENFNLEEASAGGGDGEYQYVFPNDLKKYTAGTTVLQPKDGKVYECKPFPYSGYCIQWSSHSTQFEPGIGANWQDAWIQKK